MRGKITPARQEQCNNNVTNHRGTVGGRQHVIARKKATSQRNDNAPRIEWNAPRTRQCTARTPARPAVGGPEGRSRRASAVGRGMHASVGGRGTQNVKREVEKEGTNNARKRRRRTCRRESTNGDNANAREDDVTAMTRGMRQTK